MEIQIKIINLLIDFLDILKSIFKNFIFKLMYLSRIKYNNRMLKNTRVYLSSNESKLYIGKKMFARRNVNLNIVGGTLTIEDGVFMNNNTSINCMENIFIGKNCIIGEGVKIYDHDHQFRKQGIFKYQGYNCSSIHIGENVWIGSNVVILKGVTIGDNVVIAAGSIINKDIDDDMIVYCEKKVITKQIKRKSKVC